MCGLIMAPWRYSDAQLENAMRAMHYRGADGRWGLTRNGPWAIGHVQLAIRDLSGASMQPYSDGGQMSAFVGEIFDPPNGMTESEYVHGLLFDRRYTDLHNVDGFWAMVHADRSSAFAVTDYLGSKPLYYWPEHKIVCSEIDPMFQLEGPPPLDEVYLANCIKWGYDYSGRTPYEGIYQLPAGVVLDLTGDSWNFQTYWDWRRVKAEVFTVRKPITEAIQNRLIGEREVGLLMSGGLDSSIVYYTLRELGAKVRAFSIENGETGFLPDDVTLLPEESLPTVAEAVGILQAPMDLGSLLPQVALAKAVSATGLNVCLTGDGADELFGGYSRSETYDSQASDIFCELPYYHFPRLDRVMMRNTIELRSPFIAPRVIASALRLPQGLRTKKSILKVEYSGLVPDRILQRKKVPLKSQAVKLGGVEYRAQLVQEFRRHAESHL